MATIPQVERNAAIDGLMRICGEDTNRGGWLINYLNATFPGFDWLGILRTRSQNWPPFIESGLSVGPWCDEVARMAALHAAQ